MRKPVQANIAVVGTGVGVLSFATGNCCLPLKALPRSLRRLDGLGANENHLETEFCERRPKVAVLAWWP
ncbi:MAG: hypothetical protein ACXWKB_07500 [Methyloceanibacter sp.]